jgi:GNAT superfamily N-acetyltransferase
VVVIRELDASETHLAYRAMLELRPDVGSVDDFVARVNETQRPAGYRLVASFDGEEVAAAAAGFRTGDSLAWRHYLYVDDLVTLPAFRGRGHAKALLDWLLEEARRLGCDQLHLDSGSQRYDAHRQYLKHGFDIRGFHFGMPVDRGRTPRD